MVDGKIVVDETLPDWTLPRGWERVVVSVVSGRLPTPIDPTVGPKGAGGMERCALYGETSARERLERRREVRRLTA